MGFVNEEEGSYLLFNGGGFVQEKGKIPKESYRVYVPTREMKAIASIHEDDDFMFFIKLVPETLIVIGIFPADSSPNGIEQRFRVLYPEDKTYAYFHEAMTDG